MVSFHAEKSPVGSFYTLRPKVRKFSSQKEANSKAAGASSGAK
jgi:hypothetical protein